MQCARDAHHNKLEGRRQLVTSSPIDWLQYTNSFSHDYKVTTILESRPISNVTISMTCRMYVTCRFNFNDTQVIQ